MTRKRKSKKINKMRGRRAAGYGFSAGHRASGQRGGKGMAGTKKHHYIKTVQENPRYFGRWGFKRPQRVVEETAVLNIGDIDQMADKYVERGLAEKNGKRYIIDVSKLEIDKVLGSGQVTKKIDLKGAEAISFRAKQKILDVGGTVDLQEEESE
jgi:large subunit ribosomal protein L15